MESQNRDLANIFYEQCAGTYPGHMGNVPNIPIIYSMIKAVTVGSSNCHACTKKSFAVMLRKLADELDGDV